MGTRLAAGPIEPAIGDKRKHVMQNPQPAALVRLSHVGNCAQETDLGDK